MTIKQSKKDNTDHDIEDLGADETELEVALVDEDLPLLNRLPLGSIITLTGVAVAVYALITGQIDFDAFWQALGLSGVAGGSIGIARNGAGHGID